MAEALGAIGPLNNQSRRPPCGRPGCEVVTDQLLPCRGCGEIVYCGEYCRRQHWICGHKEECTKLDELINLHTRIAYKNDQLAIERIVDACVHAMRKYLSKTIKTLRDCAFNCPKFCRYFKAVADMLRSPSSFEEHFHIMLETLEEAERLRQGEMLGCSGYQSGLAKGAIQSLRAELFAVKGKILMKEGDVEASSQMFAHAVFLAGEIESSACAKAKTRAFIEFIRGDMYKDSNQYVEAIQSFEEAYVLEQEHCSPDDIHLQEIAERLVPLYRKVGDHEKADHFAREVADNIETHYCGEYRFEVGAAVHQMACGVYKTFIAGTKIKGSSEIQKELWVEYESLIRKALAHYKGHIDSSSRPRYSKEHAELAYHEILIAFLSAITVNNYGDVDDYLELTSEYIKCCQTLKPILDKRKPTRKINEYDIMIVYCAYRERAGRPLTEVESNIVALHKSELQQLLGYTSKEEYEKHFKKQISKVILEMHDFEEQTRKCIQGEDVDD